MRISREINVVFNWLFNELLPPAVRDSRWLLSPFFRALFGSRAGLFLNFHRDVYTMSDAEFARLNADIQPVLIDRPTDLNKACVAEIVETVTGGTVLEAGCGRGYLSALLAERCNVTAVDIALPQNLPQSPLLTYKECNLEALPFADKAFDTVICAHTLEHVRDIQRSLAELRRVAGKRLIIVVPCERPYFYTFNLHIHFFPYAFSLLAVTGTPEGHTLRKLGGDWYYTENKA